MKSRNLLMRVSFVLGSFIFLIAMSFTTAESSCCPNPGAGGRCDDGYKTKIGECCGVGKCNIFCCKCKGGCRKDPDDGTQSRKSCYHKCESAHSTCSSGCTIACTGSPSDSCDILCDAKCMSEKQDCEKSCDKQYPASTSTEQNAFDTFNAHDKNFDGHLSKDEFGAIVKKNKLKIDEKKEFDSMDTDKDGRISLDEADIPMPAAIQEKISKKKKK